MAQHVLYRFYWELQIPCTPWALARSVHALTLFQTISRIARTITGPCSSLKRPPPIKTVGHLSAVSNLDCPLCPMRHYFKHKPQTLWNYNKSNEHHVTWASDSRTNVKKNCLAARHRTSNSCTRILAPESRYRDLCTRILVPRSRCHDRCTKDSVPGS